jgi:hypothetical protein
MIPPRIEVVDALMGSGKTTWCIAYMTEVHRAWLSKFMMGEALDTDRPRFVYVTPLIDEAERIQLGCPDLKFKDPKPIHGRKFWDLKALLRAGENVATTHALFSMFDGEAYDLISAGGYTLVIDEALSTVELFGELTTADRNVLFEHNMVFIEPVSKRLRWNHQDHGEYKGRFEKIRDLCDNGNLVVYGQGSDRKILLWQFPSEMLWSFDRIFIFTYLFLGSPMSLYLQAEGLAFALKSLKDGHLVDHSEVGESEAKAKLRSLINIYEGRKNRIGEKQSGKSHPFSSSWFNHVLKSNPRVLETLRGSVETYVRRDAQTPSPLNGWATFKKVVGPLKGEGYARGLIPLGTKATNAYQKKATMIYLASNFFHPVVRSFFESRGIPVYEDLYALSEFIQWLWRSRIRNYEPINVFVPSERMRGLFVAWLNSTNTTALLPKPTAVPPQSSVSVPEYQPLARKELA